MAIVQISRITNRKGLQINLPQLAGAEFGWSIDERRLFIGNGTLEEGAPVIGNTEILTEFSDIFAFQTSYTYKGEAAGYVVQTGPTPSTPIAQSLQSWLDQFATIKDFGAVGDGVTDDTEAINRALFQLFCRETNPQIRRSLFFPAGVYKVTQTIKIPPYATLVGEGLNNSIIQLQSGDDSALTMYVARTADSLQQVGANIGDNGATPPQYITISNLGFENLDQSTSVFLVQNASNCTFTNVGFEGPLTTADLTTDADATKAVEFDSTASLVCNQITFNGCVFGGTTWGINTDEQIKSVTISNSEFNTLYKGILLGVGTPVLGGATGTKIVGNQFDNIYAEGIVFGAVGLNASGHNVFYDVGNHFNGTTSPATVVIDIQGDNNVSISDLFQRDDAFAATIPRIDLNHTVSIATTNGSKIQLGTYTRDSGVQDTLVDNTVSPTVILTTDSLAFTVNYTIIRNTARRTGTMTITNAATPVWTDDYVETASTGVNLTVTESAGDISVKYTTSSSGFDATIYYSITTLS